MRRALRSLCFGQLAFFLHAVAFLPPAHGQWHNNGGDSAQFVQQLQRTALSPKSHSAVARAHTVYDRLARLWDSPRLLPKLHVVDANDQVWAAALNDGSIVITLAAVELALRSAHPVDEARLAFVLAHELSHQRADHLWRQRYFQSAPLSDSLPTTYSTRILNESQERQADAEAVISLLLTGYDPFPVIGDTRFLDEWVAAAQNSPLCGTSEADRTPTGTCGEAQRRSRAARDQLFHVATEATLFDLGMFAFATQDYEQAQRYLEAFGRLFPAASVHANIGLCHLAMGFEAWNRIASLVPNEEERLDYPLVLRENPLDRATTTLRGSDENADLFALRKKLSAHATASVGAFERALQLEPGEPSHYLHLALAYLLAGNLPMAEGVIDGKYASSFQASPASLLVKAQVAAVQREFDVARSMSHSAIAKLRADNSTPQQQILLFAAHRNLTVLERRHNPNYDPQGMWIELAQWSDENNRSLVFALAQKQMRTGIGTHRAVAQNAEARRSAELTSDRERTEHALWFDGTRYTLSVFTSGRRVVTDDRNEIVAVWKRYSGTEESVPSIQRLLARYGVPDQIAASAEKHFVVYSHAGIGFELRNEHATGWFRYRGKAGRTPSPTLQALGDD